MMVTAAREQRYVAGPRTSGRKNIVASLKRGEPVADVAAVHGLSPRRIQEIAQEEGIPARLRRPVSEAEAQTMREMFTAEHSKRAIARKLKRSDRTVRRVLARPAPTTSTGTTDPDERHSEEVA